MSAGSLTLSFTAAASPYHHDVRLDHNDDDDDDAAGYSDGDIPASAAQWLGILAGPSAKVVGWRF